MNIPFQFWRITFVSVIIGVLTLGVFTFLRNNGLDDVSARTIAVNTLVAGQLFYLFNCRKIEHPALGKGFFNNRYAFWAAGALIILQMGFVYLSFMNRFFGTQAIAATYWLYPLAAGALVFLLVELEKFITLKLKKSSEKNK